MLNNESILFSNFWDFDHNVPNYYMTPLPGKTEEVNGSIIGGYLFGINSYISDEKKAASAEVIKFLTSEYVQKEIILKYFRSYSGLFKLYDDEEVCSYTDCELIKNIQGIERPSSLIDNYEDYSSKYTTLISEFLFNNKPIKEVLREIEDITKIYYFSVKTSTYGLLFFMALLIIYFLLILSIVTLFIPPFKDYIRFFSNGLWIMYFLGILFIITSGLIKYGDVNSTKCYLNHAFMTTGISFVLTPILYKLIIFFPKTNIYSESVRNKKYSFIVLIESINIILNLLLLLSPYDVENKIINDNMNYSICTNNYGFGINIRTLQILIQLLKYFLINFLIYLEWNMKSIYKDVRALILMMGMDGILYIIFSITEILNFENYILYHTLYLGTIILFSIINHGYFFTYRIIQDLLEASDDEKRTLEIVRHSGALPEMSGYSENNTYNESISKTSNVNGSESMSRTTNCNGSEIDKSISSSSYYRTNLLSKILKIHYSPSNYK